MRLFISDELLCEFYDLHIRTLQTLLQSRKALELMIEELNHFLRLYKLSHPSKREIRKLDNIGTLLFNTNELIAKTESTLKTDFATLKIAFVFNPGRASVLVSEIENITEEIKENIENASNKMTELYEIIIAW